MVKELEENRLWKILFWVLCAISSALITGVLRNDSRLTTIESSRCTSTVCSIHSAAISNMATQLSFLPQIFLDKENHRTYEDKLSVLQLRIDRVENRERKREALNEK
tara:strand:+ start:245 stop:565 length:321 start_codon:yes stop_codon:yes gene_type:complete